MDLSKIKEALLTVTDKVYRYEAVRQQDQYIVWAEDGQAGAVHTDNRMRQQTVQGTIDYFTKKEDDPNFDRIQDALNAAGIPFYWNSTQFETRTGYIHHEWVWEVTQCLK